MSLSWIPKGILEKARKMSFSYLWRGKSENWVMPWVRWERIAKPKALGGWGLKNIFLFSKSLAAKSVWRLITTKILWTKVVLLKYVAPLSLIEWLRSPSPRTTGISVMWKSVQRAFDVVGNNLAWLVGSGNSLRIGRDPWVGCLREHILPAELCTTLDRGGYYYLAQVVDPLNTTLWQQGWKNGRTLGLNEPEALLWDRYLRALRRENIRLSEREDELIWEGDPGGIYTPKAGYAQLSIEPLQQDEKWWWRKLWKQKCPAKGKILVGQS
jgi:hypothetical protein